ncbi:trimethyllysine dioxygenase, mitochondrial-like [Acropora millepora]|uniref:trimethyllysine dioxygenase, mitochondrial-like n=1 Tax=Acropora millepora TaxID=45264 RepID=UPI001CF4877E|nr:trimethyllysine dioxygenase, mitochondrial-like [Acropora millepora]
MEYSRLLTRICSKHNVWLSSMRLRQVFGSSVQTRSNASPSAASNSVISSISSDYESVHVSWKDGGSSKFHNLWLRDHCRCGECYNATTHQKEFNILDVPLSIKPVDVAVNSENGLSITWPDHHKTHYDAEWLKKHSHVESNLPAVTRRLGKQQNSFLWDKNTIESNFPRPFEFAKVVSDQEELNALFRSIINYGFAVVEGTPTSVSAIEKTAARLGGFVKETHYGKIWEFSNEVMEHADTAYTSGYLRGHTDGTYFSHPVGIQMLHCVGHEGTGGLNLLVDGFFAAEKLRQTDRESFDFLTSRSIRFEYNSEELLLKAHGPIIELDPFDGTFSQIRFNNYDMAALDYLKYEDVARFYKALREFTAITADPNNQLWFKLTPGALLIMGNWRVLHGRSGFTGKRMMQGCYVSKDDFFGKYRSMTFDS